MLNNCLTIAEENEDELEELTRDDLLENDKSMFVNNLDHLYESPQSSTDIDEKLIVYDIAPYDPPIVEHLHRTNPSFIPCPNLTNILTNVRINKDKHLASSPLISTLSPEQQQQHSSSLSSPMLFPLDDNPTSSSHVMKMKVIQSSLSSLSDFISSTPVSNIEHHGILSHSSRTKSPDQLRSHSSSSSSEIFSSDEKLLSRSDYLLQHQTSLSPPRKSSSLKNISPNILYPIEYSPHPPSSSSHKVPTSDSGIVLDTRPASKSSIEEQLEEIYDQTLQDLRLIKQHLVEIESRLAEAMREVKG